MENNVNKPSPSGYNLITVVEKSNTVKSAETLTIDMSSVENYQDLTLDLIKITLVWYGCNDSVGLDQYFSYSYDASTGKLKITAGWGSNGVVQFKFKIQVIQIG